MKKHLTLLTFLIFTTLISFAQKHVDIYRAGVFYNSYSTIDSAIKAAYPSGDSLVLSAHTFYESNLDASTKHIIYQGTMTATDTTIIDAGGFSGSTLYAYRRGIIRDIIFQNSIGYALYTKSAAATDTFTITGSTIFRNNGSYTLYSNVIFSTSYLIISENVKLINNVCGYLILSRYLSIENDVLISNNHIVKSGISFQRGIINIPVYSLSITGRVKIINNTADSNYTAGISILNRPSISVVLGDSITISGNKVLTPNFGKGAAIYFGPMPPSSGGIPGIKSFKMGAAIFEGNEAEEGGAIYCEDSSIKLEFNGTIFRGNKAKKGGAIYSRGSLDIRNANFTNNIADTGSSIYLNTAMGGTSAPAIGVSGSRFYNSTLPANKQNHIYATYAPLTAIPPSISFNGNWWGKSDTIGVMMDKPKGTFPIYSWAVANWSIKNGTPVVKADSTFPVSAAIRYSHGIAFPASSFAVLKGTFTADTGTFTPVVAAINSANVVSSTYKTIKDSASKSINADIVAWIDADTFRKTQIVWTIDTLPNVKSIKDNYLSQVFVYPNPATDVLHIDGAEAGSEVFLYDVLGKMIKSEKLINHNSSVDISSIPAGNYLLKIRTKEGDEGSAMIMVNE